MILLNRYSRGIFSILLLGHWYLNAEEVKFLYENDNEPLFQNSSNEFISQSAQIIAKLNVRSDNGELIIFQDGFPKTYIAQDEQRMTTLKLNPGENRIDIDFTTPLIKRSRYRLFYLPNIEINSANFIIQGSSDLETNREIELSKNLSTAVNIPNIQLKLNRLPQHIDHSLIVYDTFNNPLPISENKSFHVVNLELKRGPNDFKIISRIKNQIIDEETVSLFLQKAVEILPDLKKSSRLERTPNGNWISRSPKVWLQVYIPGIQEGTALLAVNDYETRHQVVNNRFDFEVELSPNRINTIKGLWESGNTRYLDYIQISYYP